MCVWEKIAYVWIYRYTYRHMLYVQYNMCVIYVLSNYMGHLSWVKSSPASGSWLWVASFWEHSSVQAAMSVAQAKKKKVLKQISILLWKKHTLFSRKYTHTYIYIYIIIYSQKVLAKVWNPLLPQKSLEPRLKESLTQANRFHRSTALELGSSESTKLTPGCWPLTTQDDMTCLVGNLNPELHEKNHCH